MHINVSSGAGVTRAWEPSNLGAAPEQSLTPFLPPLKTLLIGCPGKKTGTPWCVGKGTKVPARLSVSISGRQEEEGDP